MALVVKDRVKETTTTTGTGSISLGGAVTKFKTFSSALSNADTTYYAIEQQGNTDEFEIGIGTYTSSGNTLARTTILSSSNSNNAVDFSAGTKNIFMTYPADKAVYEDASGNVSGVGTLNATNVVASNLMQANAISLTGSLGVMVNENIIFEGTTADNYEIFFTATDPTADRTITLPDAAGTVALTSDINATNVTSAGALMDSEVTNLAQVKAFSSSDYATAAQGTTADSAMPTTGGTFTGDISFEGATANDYETTLTVTDPTADRTITLPNATGTVLLADGDGSNLTGVQAASVDIDESTDDNVDYNIIFSDTTSSGSVQMTPQQDNNGITFNPSTNRLINGGIIQAGPRSDSDVIFQGYGGDSTSEYIAMGVQTGYANITAGGVGSTSTDLRIRTANSGTEADKVTIKADGKTGIGTTSPSEVLDVVGNIAVSGTVDGVDIAARDAILTSTTTTANAAMPKSGGTFTDDVTFEGAQYTNRNVVWDKTDSALEFADNAKIVLGQSSDLQIYHNALDSYIQANISGNLYLRNATDDFDVVIECDNGLGGITNYLRADGSTGEVLLYHYGSEKLKTQSGGVDVTGNITVSGTVDGKDVSTLTTATAAADEATALAIALG